MNSTTASPWERIPSLGSFIIATVSMIGTVVVACAVLYTTIVMQGYRADKIEVRLDKLESNQGAGRQEVLLKISDLAKGQEGIITDVALIKQSNAYRDDKEKARDDNWKIIMDRIQKLDK